jgi:exonuclease VII small subunit
MARATTTKSRPRRKAVAEAVPKRRPGRPLGSKNRKAVASVLGSSSKAKTSRSPTTRAAIATPRLNKAELEARVAKLERTLTRLREQNKELKRAALDAAEQRDALEAARQAKSAARAAKPRRAPAKVRRGNAGMQQPRDGGAAGDAGADD